MSERNDGGPAFPEPCNESGFRASVSSGMTLRDYFAAKAMTAMVCADTDSGRYRNPETLDRCAGLSYAMADAMLAARGKA